MIAHPKVNFKSDLERAEFLKKRESDKLDKIRNRLGMDHIDKNDKLPVLYHIDFKNKYGYYIMDKSAYKDE